MNKVVRLAVFFLLSALSAHAQQLYINELVASNTNDQMDNFFEYDDWLEIYNGTGSIVDLGGYYLTDDPNNLMKFHIPTTNPGMTMILPNSHLVFWCDKDSSLQGENHTNFTLSANGETVLLVAQDGMTILDSITYPQMMVDISYGRTCDGCNTWQYFNNTTWQAQNAEIINPNGELLFINEIQTVNTSTIHDLYFEYEPWIEVYNPNLYQVNLAGYTIDINGTGFVIPNTAPYETVIPAGGFRNFWLDSDLNQGALHVNLTMPSTGTANLIAPNGTTLISSFTFSAIAENTSNGCSTDGSPTHITFNAPTPTVSNALFVIPGEHLFINEIMPANLSTLADNAGEFDDWFELFNPNDVDVDLSGYYMSDNPEIRNRWMIPTTYPDSVTVPAHGYRVFFADNDQTQGVQHASFSLNNNAEYLGLFSVDGYSLVDELAWNNIGVDSSWGRQGDGSPIWNIITSSPDSTNGPYIFVQENNTIAFQVFPNPTQDIVQFSTPQSGRWYDQNGKHVASMNLSKEMNLGHLAAGKYLFINSGRRAVWISKL